MTITTFDKATVRSLTIEIEAALQSVADAHGVSIKRGSASFDQSTIKLSIQIATIDDSGMVSTREAMKFPTFCKMFNLDPEDLGKTFHDQGRLFTVTGLKPGNPKFPVMVKRDDGREYKYPASTVVRGLHPDRDPKGSFGATRDPLSRT